MKTEDRKYEMIKVAISVVCFNNEKEIIKFAQNLALQKDKDKLALLITCNECKKMKFLKEEIKKINIITRVYSLPENLGYLQGCLKGLEQFEEQYEWAVISNTDIEFDSIMFFSKFIEKKYSNDVAYIGPDIRLKASGESQNPFMLKRPSKAKMKMLQVMYSTVFLFRLYFGIATLKNNLNRKNCVCDEKIMQTYALHGSFFFLKKEIIEKIIKDAVEIFMYEEEIYIAEMVARNHKLALYDGELHIVHNENQVTGKINYVKKQQWFKNSIDYIVNRFY